MRSPKLMNKQVGQPAPERKRPPRKRPQAAEKQQPGSEVVETITIDGPLDFHSLEAMKLELRRLAQGCGLEVQGIQVVTEAKPSAPRRR